MLCGLGMRKYFTSIRQPRSLFGRNQKICLKMIKLMKSWRLDPRRSHQVSRFKIISHSPAMAYRRFRPPWSDQMFENWSKKISPKISLHISGFNLFQRTKTSDEVPKRRLMNLKPKSHGNIMCTYICAFKK